MSRLSDTTDLNLDKGRVLVIGDAIFDRFVYGEVERISPEAPVPILRVVRETAMPGGAGNVALGVAALGAAVHLVSVVGQDDVADALARHFDSAAWPVAHTLVRAADRETPIKIRFIAGVQQTLRVDRETSTPVAATNEKAALAAVEDEIGRADVVILSDYGKGVLTPGVIAGVIRLAQKRGIPVIVDPKGRDYARYRGADIVTPNRRELTEATGLPAASDGEVVAAAKHLMATAGIKSVLATRGAKGLSYVSDEETLHVPARPCDVFDVSGAGDTVVATLAAALATGIPIAEAAELANAAGGIVVGKLGTAVVSAAELRDAIRHQAVGMAEDRVVEVEAAAARVARWRERGLRIGFTNGCFDLLHPGHVSLLAQAKAACDRLVVGLNSDASVRRLKGETRPVQGETARAQVLASIGDVDLVVLFGEDTPVELIRSLRPDVLVKGADYTLDQVVGRDVVEGYGGRVVLAGLVDGFSTTGTIKKMKS